VYFEEWDEPMISGIAWVSELIDAAGGMDVFADRAPGKSAKERIVTKPEVVERIAGHHYRLLVRQEIPAREGGRTTRLRSDAGCPKSRHSRDQIAAHPPTGSGGIDGGLGRASAVD
jgi:hypothetical protein